MAKDRGDIVESVAPVEEPASEGALEARERVPPVDQVVCTRIGIEGFTGGLDGQSIQVVAEDFGAEVLLGSQPGHAGQMFEGETMLDPFERFLNSPPRVIESAEFIGWVSVGVEERGDEDASLVTEDLENESNLTRLGGDFVIKRVLLAGSGCAKNELR